jgi:hypothetical protein
LILVSFLGKNRTEPDLLTPTLEYSQTNPSTKNTKKRIQKPEIKPV